MPAGVQDVHVEGARCPLGMNGRIRGEEGTLPRPCATDGLCGLDDAVPARTSSSKMSRSFVTVQGNVAELFGKYFVTWKYTAIPNVTHAQ